MGIGIGGGAGVMAVLLGKRELRNVWRAVARFPGDWRGVRRVWARSLYCCRVVC